MKLNVNHAKATILGIAALLMWNTLFGVLRSLSEQLGSVTASAAIYLLGGSLGCIYMFSRFGFKVLKQFPKKYLFACGGFFVLYMITIQLAIGWAANRQQAMEVVLINYLWPALTMTLFIPILKYRARLWLMPGIAIAIAGVTLAVTSAGEFSLDLLCRNLRTNYLPYGLAATSAVAWGLYSNFSRLFAAEVPRSATSLFLFCCGLIFYGLSMFAGEQSAWHFSTVLELLYAAIFPCLLAYLFWELAMRKGNAVLVTSVSYLSPLFTTIVSGLYLHVMPGRQLWVACGLIIVGAVICKFSVIPQHESAESKEI